MVQISKSSSLDSLSDELVNAKPSDLSHIQLPYQTMKLINQPINQSIHPHVVEQNDYESDLESDNDSEGGISSQSLTHHSIDGSLSDASDNEQLFDGDMAPIDQSTQQIKANHYDEAMPGDDNDASIEQSFIHNDPDDISNSIVDVVDPADQPMTSIDVTEKKPPTWKVLTALVTAQLCWSGFHVIAKSLFNDGLIPPQVLPAFRTIGVVPVQAAWAYRSNPKFYVVSPRHHAILFVLAVLGNTISQQFFNFGESLSSATLAGSMQPLIPVLTTVFAISLRREMFSWLKALGVVIAVAGSLIVVLLGSSSGNSSNGSNPIGGAFCFLVQTFCTSLYITIQKPLFNEGINVDTFNFYLFVYGGIGHMFIGAAFAHEVAWSQLPWTIIPVLVYVSIISSFVAFLLFVFATKHLPASISSLGICLQSFFSPTLGAIFLGESMSIVGVFGGLLIVAGIVLVVYIKNRETKAEHALATEKLVELESINTELEKLNSELANHSSDVMLSSANGNSSSLIKSVPFPHEDLDDDDSDDDVDDRFGYPQKSVRLDDSDDDSDDSIDGI